MILTTKPENWIHKIVELVQERHALGDTISRAWKNRQGWSLTERIPGSLQRRLIACNEAYLELAGRLAEDLLDHDPRPYQISGHGREHSHLLKRMIEAERRYCGVNLWRSRYHTIRAVMYRAWPAWLDSRVYVIGIDHLLGERPSENLPEIRPSLEYAL